jgi:putative transposase
LKKAIGAVLSEGAWQRCYVHFLRNALDYLPRKADDDCMQELRWLYDRRNLTEAQRDLAAWLHHKHLKSSNMLERLNEEIRRRTRVVRIFPNANSCLRIRALCAETHETWLEDSRYLNMDLLREERKEQLRKAA